MGLVVVCCFVGSGFGWFWCVFWLRFVLCLV